MPTNSTFQTPRLTARSLRPGDGPLLNAAVQDSLPQLQPFLAWATPPPAIADSEAYAQRSYEDFQSGRAYVFGIFLNPANLATPESLFVCSVSFTPAPAALNSFIGPGDWWEIGYWCSTPYTRRGYMTEASEAALHWAMREAGLAWFIIRTDEFNQRSRQIAARLGFIETHRHGASLLNRSFTELIYQRRFLR